MKKLKPSDLAVKFQNEILIDSPEYDWKSQTRYSSDISIMDSTWRTPNGTETRNSINGPLPMEDTDSDE